VCFFVDFHKISKKHAELTFEKSTGYVMHRQFNIQQLYALSTLYLCVLYLPENTQRILPHITNIGCLISITEMKSVYCAVRIGSLNKAVFASSLKG
jgi:hypothetical protein